MRGTPNCQLHASAFDSLPIAIVYLIPDSMHKAAVTALLIIYALVLIIRLAIFYVMKFSNG